MIVHVSINRTLVRACSLEISLWGGSQELLCCVHSRVSKRFCVRTNEKNCWCLDRKLITRSVAAKETIGGAVFPRSRRSSSIWLKLVSVNPAKSLPRYVCTFACSSNSFDPLNIVIGLVCVKCGHCSRFSSLKFVCLSSSVHCFAAKALTAVSLWSPSSCNGWSIDGTSSRVSEPAHICSYIYVAISK